MRSWVIWMSFWKRLKGIKLGCVTNFRFVIRRISGQQGDQGIARVSDGTATQTDFVAAVYESASHVRQLEATFYVTAQKPGTRLNVGFSRFNDLHFARF
jgi:hypothetical protein